MFVEVPNDMCAMIDIAKVADLVLLLIDAKFGFEMETFEFLNIMQVHGSSTHIICLFSSQIVHKRKPLTRRAHLYVCLGFPKILGVLTHLDQFQLQRTMRRRKKDLKHRFWADVYEGAKLFYLSGLLHDKWYPKNEVANLARFISIQKFRPLTWRNSHPYVLADRFEDVTHPDAIQRNPKVDRTIYLYGYTRGTHLKPWHKLHLAGVGDFFVGALTPLPDPLPLPELTRLPIFACPCRDKVPRIFVFFD
jgi:ribosome biogenesis protein BMS1